MDRNIARPVITFPDDYTQNPYSDRRIEQKMTDQLYMQEVLQKADYRFQFAMKQMDYEHQKQVEEMKDAYKKRQMDHELVLEELKTRNSLEVERQKHEWRERHEQGIYARKMQRELAKLAVVVDSDGFLCSEIKFPDGLKLVSDKVLNKRDLRMTSVQDEMIPERKFGILSWEGTAGILLDENHFDAKGLMKTLERNGVTFFVGRERKLQIAELIFAYLYENANQITLPPFQGWFDAGEVWKFESNPENTMDFQGKGE